MMTPMDTSDIAAAALKPDGVGVCNCSRHTNKRKPIRSCPKCHGTGKLTACLDCEGSGWKPAINAACPKCAGKGYIPPPQFQMDLKRA
jgi:DnaJ-class molecular chaperone